VKKGKKKETQLYLREELNHFSTLILQNFKEKKNDVVFVRRYTFTAFLGHKSVYSSQLTSSDEFSCKQMSEALICPFQR